MTPANLMISADNQCCYHHKQLVKNNTSSLENDSAILLSLQISCETIVKHYSMLCIQIIIYLIFVSYISMSWSKKTLNINFDLVIIAFKLQNHPQKWINRSKISWKSAILDLVFFS